MQHTSTSIVAHRPAVRAFLLKVVGNESLAEDLTQEVFIRALRTSSDHRQLSTLKTWLCSIALNLARDHFRSQSRQQAFDAKEKYQVKTSEEGEEIKMLSQEMANCIGEYLLLLPTPQYEVVAYHDMAGMTHGEIAQTLEISVANSRVILHRGREAMRKLLEQNCVLDLTGDRIPCERSPEKK
jgi:RNA polymerase sigma-70 factor (ECF subfamily)